MPPRQKPSKSFFAPDSGPNQQSIGAQMGKRVVVLGSNFAGLTAAITLKEKLGKEIDVTVISASDKFIFMPSLIWVPFGLREAEDSTFPVGPVLEKAGVTFVHSVAVKLNLKGQQVMHTLNG